MSFHRSCITPCLAALGVFFVQSQGQHAFAFERSAAHDSSPQTIEALDVPPADDLTCANVLERLKAFREAGFKYGNAVSSTLDSASKYNRRFAMELRLFEGQNAFVQPGASRGLFDVADHLARLRTINIDATRSSDGFLAKVIELLPTCLKP